jgi:hypothetical protein
MNKARFLELITETNNKTLCPVRILSILGVLEYIIIAAFNYKQHATFDLQGFGVGFATLIGGIGVALGLKKDTPKDGG